MAGRSKLVLVLILVSGIFWRAWNLPERFILESDQARNLIKLKYFFGYTPGEASALPIYTPWILLTLISLVTCYCCYKIGEKIFNRKFGLFLTLVASWSSYAIWETNLLSINLLGLFFASLTVYCGIYFLKKKDFLSPIVGIIGGYFAIMFSESSKGNIIENMGMFIVGRSDAGYFLLSIGLIAVLLFFWKKKIEKIKPCLFLILTLLLIGIISTSFMWLGCIVFVASVLFLWFYLIPHEEVLFWVFFGIIGFWSMQNMDLIKIKSQNQKYFEVAGKIENINKSFVSLSEIENSENSLLPIMYILMQKGKISNEGQKVAILEDNKKPVVYSIDTHMANYTKEVSLEDVYLGKY